MSRRAYAYIGFLFPIGGIIATEIAFFAKIGEFIMDKPLGF